MNQLLDRYCRVLDGISVLFLAVMVVLEGLAPLIVEELLGVLRRIMGTEEMAVVIVEQNAKKVLPETSRAIILERGAVADAGPSAALLGDAPTLDRLLGVAR